MKSRNYNSKIAREINLGHADLININTSDRQNAPNWQRKTMKLPHFTMSRCIATPFWDWFRLIFHGTLYQMSSCDGLIQY